MITEQDLRTALTRRAAQAPTFDPARVLNVVTAARAGCAPAAQWPRRLAVAGAALSVAAAATIAAVLAQGPSSSSNAAGAPQHSSSPTSAHPRPSSSAAYPSPSTSAAYPNPSTSAARPPSSSAIGRPPRSSGAASEPGGPPTSATVTTGTQPPAIVWVSAKDPISNVDQRANVEYVTVQAGIKHTSIAGFRTGVFSASRVADAVPVRVDGHSGLFGSVSVWPVNGRPDPRSGKQDSAQPSLAWQLSNGSWVVLQIDTPSHPTRAQLLAAAGRVHVMPAD